MEGDDETTSVTMIDDEVYSNGGGLEGRSKPNLSSELLDIEVYAGLYSGRTKITRLMFVADRCGNQVMKLDALRMAYDEIKKGENTNLFKEVVEKIDGKLGSEYGLDQTWVDTVDRKAEVRKKEIDAALNSSKVKLLKEVFEIIDGNLGRGLCLDQSWLGSVDLEVEITKEELNAYRTNLIKESIRAGYNDFGDFYYSHGHLADAFKSYSRTRDYCSTSKHILQMCLNAILVSIEMGQFAEVQTWINSAEQVSEALNPVAIAKLLCVAGLYHLELKEYKLAAYKFLETGPELGDTYTEVISPQDVATYGGLCALASFDKTELKRKVIDNLNFRYFLEPVTEVKNIINAFYSSNYTYCLECLESIKAVMLLDIHLHDHVERLYGQVRQKALIEYAHPSVPIDLHMMAGDFKTDVSGLEKELEALITDNHIQARIDSRNKILYAEKNHLKSAAAAASSEVGRCQSIVSKYEKALMAFDDLYDYIALESKVGHTETQLANIESMLKEKLPSSERIKLEGHQSCVFYHLKELNAEVQALAKTVKDGIRGKSKEELKSLLKQARYDLEMALHVRSRMKKEHTAAEVIHSENISQELVRKLASTKVDKENTINLIFRMLDGSRRCYRFLISDRLQSVFSYINEDEAVTPGTYKLVVPYPSPRLVFSDSESMLSLSDLGLSGRREVLLFLEPV